MNIVINLTEKELKKLSELTDVEIVTDDESIFIDDDVTDAIKILLENL
jgi:hypothetical protein